MDNVATIHIRVKQRNGRKSITTVEGLSRVQDLNITDFCKKLKKLLACNGSIAKDEKTQENVLQFQGDHRDVIKNFILQNKLVDPEQIKLYGF